MMGGGLVQSGRMRRQGEMSQENHLEQGAAEA